MIDGCRKGASRVTAQKDKRKWGVLAALMLFGAGVLGMHLFYQQRVSDELEGLLRSDLAAGVETRCAAARADVRDAADAAQNIASMLEAGVLTLKEETGVSVEHGEPESRYVYQPRAAWFAEAVRTFGTEATETLRVRLDAGEEAVTDLYLRADGIWACSVLAGVLQGGERAGVIRIDIPAARLVETAPENGVFAPSDCLLLRADGSIVPRGAIQDGGEGQLQSLQRVDGSGADALRAAVAQPQGGTVRFEVGQQTVFAAAADLGYYDWRLVCFVSADGLLPGSRAILRDSALLGGALCLATALFVAALFRMIGRQRRGLLLSQKRYELLARFSDTLLFEYVYSTDALDWSDNAQGALDLDTLHMPSCLRGGGLHIFTHPDDVNLLREALWRRVPEGETHYLELRLRCRGGAYDWFGCRCQTLYDGGVPVLLVGKLTDISAHKAREVRLQRKASADGLTSLLNAGAVREQVRACLPEGGSFFMLDIDDFKGINDTFGHATGDAALRTVASVLRDTFRGRDPVGRLGGDEFVAFMVGTCEPEAVCAKAEEIRRRIAAVRVEQAPSLRLSVSIGVAQAAPGDDASAVYAAADRAMYEAKHMGKNAYAVVE